MLPELSLFNVGKTEFPVFIRLINALEEALSLFFFRKVEEKLDATRSVTVKMVSLRAPMRFSF
jgi:hypothetical protein